MLLAMGLSLGVEAGRETQWVPPRKRHIYRLVARRETPKGEKPEETSVLEKWLFIFRRDKVLWRGRAVAQREGFGYDPHGVITMEEFGDLSKDSGSWPRKGPHSYTKNSARPGSGIWSVTS